MKSFVLVICILFTPSVLTCELLEEAINNLVKEVQELKYEFKESRENAGKIIQHEGDSSCACPTTTTTVEKSDSEDPRRRDDSIDNRPYPAMWVEWTGSLPKRPVIGGKGPNGESYYIGMALLIDGYHTGTVVLEDKKCYIPWGGKVIPSKTFLILTNPDSVNLTWEASRGGKVPQGAIKGGKVNDRDRYIGRVAIDGAYAIGKVPPEAGAALIPHEGKEVLFTEFEVLCASNL